jgi:hypothetical protein
MNWLYPRTIAVHRPANADVTGGAPSVRKLPYSGVTAAAETVVLTGVPAAIQFITPAGSRNNKLPADTNAPGGWKILLPRSAAALGAIQNRDIIVDDQGQRYQAEDAYWTPLGYQLRTRLLEV